MDYEKIIKKDIFQFNFKLGKLFLISNKNNYIFISIFISKIKKDLKVFVRNNKNTRIFKNIYIFMLVLSFKLNKNELFLCNKNKK